MRSPFTRLLGLLEGARTLSVADWAAAALSVASLLAYCLLRARAVGGCDSFAYLADSAVLRGMAPVVDGGLDPSTNPAVVPLCHVAVGRQVVALFPPGFPALLAVAGVVGWEHFVTPIIGAVSVLLVYLSARGLARPLSCVALAAAWASAPIVVWGATRMMSDLPAATALLAAHLLLRRGHVAWTGALLALAIAIRPASLLMAPVLGVVAWGQGRFGRFAAVLGGGVLALVAFLCGRFGSPLSAAYGKNLAELAFVQFWPQLTFLAIGALCSFGPVALLAAVGVRALGRRSLALLIWGVLYFAFYSLWRHPFDEWWWQRFALSSLPAWMVLAAAGCGFAEARASRLRKPWERVARVSLTALLLGTAALGAWQSSSRGLLRPGFDQRYRDDAETVARLVPADSLVGAVNFSGPLRLYGDLETFDYTHPLALELAERALRRDRPVYLVAEPWLLRSDPMARRLAHSLVLRPNVPLTQWPGLGLYRLELPSSRRVPKRARLDIGTAAARPALRSGWSTDERDEKKSFCWTVGHTATVSLELEPGKDYVLSFRAARFSGVSEQCVNIDLDGKAVSRLCLDEVEWTYEVPERLVPKSAHALLGLTFSGARSPSSLGASDDTRQLAAAFDWIEIRPAVTTDP